MANNEIYKSLVPENARFVGKQDTSMYVPKARGSTRFGLVLYSIDDFIIDSHGRLRLALPKLEQKQLYNEIYGDTRDNTVLADPPINLKTLSQKDIELNQKIDDEIEDREDEVDRLDTRIDDEISDREDEVDRLDLRVDNEIADREYDYINLNLRVDNEVDILDLRIDNEVEDLLDEVDRLDTRIDLIIQDDLPYNTYSTYSSLKISELINEAKLQGLHFVGYIGSTVGKNYDGDDVGAEGQLWHVSTETSSPILDGSWNASTMYVYTNGAWVQYGSDYSPDDFAFWKNVNIPDEQINAWFYLQGVWEVLDFNVDMGQYYNKDESNALFKTQSDFDEDMENYFTKEESEEIFKTIDDFDEDMENYFTKEESEDLFKTIDDFDLDMMDYYDKEESDERFKSIFEYGDYLSESTVNDIKILNIDNLNMPTSGLLTSFVQGTSTIDAENVEDAIKLIDTRPVLKDISTTPTRAGDYAIGENGVYKSALFSEDPITYAWQFVTTDLSTLVPKTSTNYNFVTELSFLHDEETGYLSARTNKRNITSGETGTDNINIPVATSETDGIMPYTAMLSLTELDNRLLAVESGVQSYFIEFPSDTPSQEFLTDIYTSLSGSETIPNLARLIDVSRNIYYEWSSVDDEWIGPNIFRYGAGDIGVLGLVSSSEAYGQIYIEPVTGIMSLNGYSYIMDTLNLLYNDDIEEGVINLDQIPNLPASRITSGVFDIARIPAISVAKGGTGVTTLAQNRIMFTGAVDGDPIRTGAEFGSLNTILASNGVSELPSFKTLSALGSVVTGSVNQTVAGNKTFTGETVLANNNTLKLLEIRNQDPTQYARMMFTGDQKQFTYGVGNSNATIEALRNKFYAYDFTTNTPIMYGDQTKMKFSGRVGISTGTEADDAVNLVQLNTAIQEAILKDPDKTYLVVRTPADNDTFTLSTGDSGSPNYTIEWGDGSSDDIVDTSYPTHTYEKAGIYLITISGSFANGIVFGSSSNVNKDKMIEVYGGINYPAGIGNSAFRACSNLTTAIFPKVMILGNNAFNNCPNLTTTNFPRVTNIGEYAFYYCSNLTTAIFPKATGLGKFAFGYCSNLKTLTLGNVETTGTGTRFQNVVLDTLTISGTITDTDITRIKTFFTDNGGTFSQSCEIKYGLQVEKVPTLDNDVLRKIDIDRKVSVSTTGAVTQTLTPDVFYDFTGSLTSLTIAFGTPITDKANEYKFQFLSGATAPSLSVPSSVIWVDTGIDIEDLEPEMLYQVSILNNVGIIVGVGNV